MQFKENQQDYIKQLCIKHYVKSLYLFGSYAKENQTENSDIDFVVLFDNLNMGGFDYFDNYMSLKESLEDCLNKVVELIEGQAIKNPVFKEAIDKEKILIYERQVA